MTSATSSKGHVMSEAKAWGTPAQELRAIAQDCIKMRRPDLAVQALRLAAQADREEAAMAFADAFTPQGKRP